MSYKPNSFCLEHGLEFGGSQALGTRFGPIASNSRCHSDMSIPSFEYPRTQIPSGMGTPSNMAAEL